MLFVESPAMVREVAENFEGMDHLSRTFATQLLAAYPEWSRFVLRQRSAGDDHHYIVVEVPATVSGWNDDKWLASWLIEQGRARPRIAVEGIKKALVEHDELESVAIIDVFGNLRFADHREDVDVVGARL